MKRISWLVAVLGVMLLASSAQAQDTAAPRNMLTQGSKSLSFSVPGGGNPYAAGAAGLWYMLTNEMNLGLNVGLGIDRAGGGTSFSLLLAPALRYYLMTDGVVAPFFFGQTNFLIANPAGPGDTNFEWGIAGGLGAEWFPVRQFSISGQVGLGVDIVREGDEPGIGTFTSQLAANIYW
jgi:hypothetical protein